MNIKKGFLFLLTLFLPLLSREQTPPVPVNDTVSAEIYVTVQVNVLKNDSDPDGDSLYISSAALFQAQDQGTVSVQDSSLVFTLNANAADLVMIRYFVKEKQPPFMSSFGYLVVHVTNPCRAVLDINNVDALYYAHGSHYKDMAESTQHYRVPKGGMAGTIYSLSHWIGGLDPNGLIHIAADRYRFPGVDFSPGPVSKAAAYHMGYDKQWNYIWRLKASDIEYHKTHYYVPGYQPIHDIQTWPGNGAAILGQAPRLAPFFDVNNDGLYDPMSGDYPLIRGDECLFFIHNDTRGDHGTTHGRKLGIEVLGMAYAFDCPSDSALFSATFLHYELINRSDTVYHNTKYGVFVDTDLGYCWDDYVGCDVTRGSFYTYNGKTVDGTGGANEYGAYPPMQSVVMLGGPFLDADNLDNPAYDTATHSPCNESINGWNFGDNVIDNERYGLTSFTGGFYCSGPPCALNTDTAFYRALNLMYLNDTTHLCWPGGGPPFNFMLPGLTDPCNWGTQGTHPPGYTTGAGGNGPVWSMINNLYVPDDRWGLLVSGPFTFHPGDREEIDLALVFARNYQDTARLAALPILERYTDSIRAYFKKEYSPCGGSFTSVHAPLPVDVAIYPNPANGFVNIKLPPGKRPIPFILTDLSGKQMAKGQLPADVPARLDVSGLSTGLYVMTFWLQNQKIQKKLVVLR